jgi:hypothetical protein
VALPFVGALLFLDYKLLDLHLVIGFIEQGYEHLSPRGEASWTHWSGNLQACLYHNATVIETRDQPYLLESTLVRRQTCR